METTNVGLNEETVTTNMVVTYPGKDGIEIAVKGQIIKVKDYLKEAGDLNIKTIKNSERELRAYLAKYDPKKLEKYEDKGSKKAKKSIDEGIEM